VSFLASTPPRSIGIGTGTTLVTNYRQCRDCTAWNGPLNQAWSYRVLCGPGAATAPVLSGHDVPRLANPFGIGVSLGVPSSAAFLFTGASRTAWGAIPLPFELGVLGAPGCRLLVSGDIVTGHPLDALGAASVSFGIPADTGLLGASIHQQFFVLDGGANALGLATTNGGTATIGRDP
jgi:hypothetical protein